MSQDVRAQEQRPDREDWIGCFAAELLRVRPRWTAHAARTLALSQWAQRRLQSPETAARSWIGSHVWAAFEDSGFSS